MGEESLWRSLLLIGRYQGLRFSMVCVFVCLILHKLGCCLRLRCAWYHADRSPLPLNDLVPCPISLDYLDNVGISTCHCANLQLQTNGKAMLAKLNRKCELCKVQ